MKMTSKMYLLSALFSAFFSTLAPLHKMISVNWRFFKLKSPEKPKKALLECKNKLHGKLHCDVVSGANLFILLSDQLRSMNSDHINVFKNHLDVFQSSIPDHPTMTGLGRTANSTKPTQSAAPFLYLLLYKVKILNKE